MVETAEPAEPLDETLVARVARGEVEAFAALYDRYARTVYVMAAHLLGAQAGEEAVQEVFLRLWRRAGQFDASRGLFAAWFMAVARHHVQSELRRLDKTRQLMAVADVEAVLASTQDPTAGVEDIVLQGERAAAVRRALRSLPPEQRQVLVLAYFGDLSHSAIAEALGWPLGTVKKRIQLGMAKLRAALAEPDAPIDDPRPAKSRPIVPELAHSGGQDR
ncbi:MAG: RNA polymerase sigma factor [Thermomicrobiales bacterium]